MTSTPYIRYMSPLRIVLQFLPNLNLYSLQLTPWLTLSRVRVRVQSSYWLRATLYIYPGGR